MEKDSDTMLPYLGLERFPDHPESQVSSGGEALVLSPSESPATKASTLQSKEISREKFYRAVPLMESRRSQLPEKPLEPDDMQYEKMYIEKGLSKKRHSRVGYLYLCIFTSLTPDTLRCQAYTGNQRPWGLHEGVLVLKPLEVLSMNTFGYIPVAPHK